ncbi:MAG: methyltransferase domain-containing protein [Erysipelotrichia bacterium]|nr:methyltransferase domain-containing protein [Erysipelotrichia bacterium]
MSIISKTTQLDKHLIKPYLNKDSITVDMTIGNGNDTLFLALNSKKVYGFDIQQIAIEKTEKLLKENGLNNYKLICDSHSNLDKYVSELVDVFVFNFGYLPKSDKTITTNAESSLEALKKALELLKVNGLISMTLYHGHRSGVIEREKILDYVNKLDYNEYYVLYVKPFNQKNNPPEIVLITRKK